MLSIKKCTKQFNECTVINNLTIDLFKEKTAILGENGAGKTTLIKIIVGLLTPDQGSIEINGKDLYKYPRERVRIGYVAVDSFFYEKLTVLENIKLISSLYGVKLSIQEIKDIAIQTDIIEYLSKNVGELSSGMKQKVSLTCALLHNPEFLILDEPFNALDVFATSVLSDILKKWSKGILFTSHIPETVYNLADRVIVLKNGYIHHDVKISSFKNINEFENWVKGHISIKNRASSSDGNSENGTNIKTPKLPIL